VDIFQNHQTRPIMASMHREQSRKVAVATVARGVVHGVIKRAPFTRLWQVEQIIEKPKQFRWDELRSDQAVARQLSQFGSGGVGKAQKTQ
jgi:hypothetical protein